ncbi:MAG: polysaccharide transporter [Cyanobacteria bacterium QS_8_64_29]|nr:MAG: polysaccharide transporter [Cyanobacteria bacterium QS_8_64_29]
MNRSLELSWSVRPSLGAWSVLAATALVLAGAAPSAARSPLAQIPTLPEPEQPQNGSPSPADPNSDAPASEFQDRRMPEAESAPAPASGTEQPATQPTQPARPQNVRRNANPGSAQSVPYLLGPGDTIQVNVFGQEDLSGSQRILGDGSVALPLVGRIKLAGLTLTEASNQIKQQLSEFIKRPLVTVSLAQTRPVRVTIVGEVNRPGSYIVSSGQARAPSQAGTTGSTGSASSRSGAGDRFSGGIPTVTEALQVAGGITESTDVRNIQIKRLQGTNRANTLKVNLWELLQSGNANQNVALRDGDRIVVPEAQKLSPAEATEVASANFAPDTIQVGVVGEVKSPGRVELKPNTPLNQALLAAGGFDNKRADKGEVELVRLQEDGTVKKRTIPVDFSEGINPEKNPTLRNRDVVIVKRSTLTTVGDTLESILGPFTNVFSVFRLFDIFN